jgi:type II secretory ATPase GspE/PulE/Tfp pilus assembly ATPase PilB-like protein
MSADPPDTTARMLRALMKPGAASGAAAQFVWPAPPYHEFVEGVGHRTADERCVLFFKDGTKRAGTLLAFNSDAALLEFRPQEEAARIGADFADLLAVQLTRPVPVRRQLFSVGAAESASDGDGRQPFSIKMRSGKTFRGETLGHVQALCGVFLFLPEARGEVLRYFVPREAARSASIGKPIGQLLVDRKLASPEAVDAALERQQALRSRRLGEYLTENRIVSQEQLAAALKQQRSRPVQKLGEALIELGYLTQAELDEALAVASKNRSLPLGQILADMGVIDGALINHAMASKLGIPVVNLREMRIDPEVLKKIPLALAYRYQAIPVAQAESSLVVALEDPMNATKLDELRFVAGTVLIPVMASREDIQHSLERCYGPAQDSEGIAVGEAGVEQLANRLAVETGELDLNDKHAAENDSTLVKLVNRIIADAIEQNASDIHFEANPRGRAMRVRFRKDGALVNYQELPFRFSRAIISRIKIMSQLDITERRRPHDGKIEFKRSSAAGVDLRVATIPTANGLEDVVIRVLLAATPVPLEQLGLDGRAQQTLQRLISRPHGLLLVCGPTGSGKTTTLHSLLRHLNTPDCKIWTAEDPIEITQPGLRQVQVNAKIGWTFAAAMRSFMRADPDVIMVGEMRDAETAKVGIEASLTGHLVLSTLHTNSAPESVVRLLDLGMDAFNFADALLGVLAQRLVRRLCLECRQPYAPSAAELGDLAMEYCGGDARQAEQRLKRWQVNAKTGAFTLYRAKGCKNCDRTGYKGRVGVYELLEADEAIRRLIQKRAPAFELTAAAMAGGMCTLKQDGIEKVLLGLTDIHEVRRV